MKFRLYCFALVLVISASHSAYGQRLIYHVDCKTAGDHYLKVSLRPVQLRPDELTFQMPVSATGVYGEVHYGRFVKDFKAVDTAGHSLSVTRDNDDHWTIHHSEAIGEITYRVEDSYSDGSGPLAGMAKIDGNGVLANSVAVFGYVKGDKGIPMTVSFSLPDKWMIVTPLEPASDAPIKTVQLRLHQTIYDVDGYEELADAPFMAAPNAKRVVVWKDGDATYYVVNAGSSKFPIDSFAVAAKTISKIETKFFRDNQSSRTKGHSRVSDDPQQTPFSEYMFLVYDQPGHGPLNALPHGNSSVYEVYGTEWPELNTTAIRQLASTFFQTWNGKQFHVSPLGPVDYTAPIDSRSLWFSEGVSEYMSDLLLVQDDLIPLSMFYADASKWRGSLMAKDFTSLEDLSLAQKHYAPTVREELKNRGALTAMMLDIDIRNRTGNRRSLATVLHAMNEDVAKGKTYDDKLLYQTIADYADINLDHFYSSFIAGRDTIPLEAYLNKAGLTCELREGPFRHTSGFSLSEDSGLVRVQSVSLSPDMPLRVGDTVIEINGVKPSALRIAAFDTITTDGQPSSSAVTKLIVERSKKRVKVSVPAETTAEKVTATPIQEMVSATKGQKLFRSALLGKHHTIMKPIVYALPVSHGSRKVSRKARRHH